MSVDRFTDAVLLDVHNFLLPAIRKEGVPFSIQVNGLRFRYEWRNYESWYWYCKQNIGGKTVTYYCGSYLTCDIVANARQHFERLSRNLPQVSTSRRRNVGAFAVLSG